MGYYVASAKQAHLALINQSCIDLKLLRFFKQLIYKPEKTSSEGEPWVKSQKTARHVIPNTSA